MKDCLQEGSHYRAPHRLLKNPLHGQWLGTADCRVWYYLVPNVIRAPMKKPMLNMVYEKYFLEKGLLCACGLQDEIAKFLGLKSASQPNRCLKHMAEQGLIRVHHDAWAGDAIKVYELGYLSAPPERNQMWHMHMYFYKKQGEINLSDYI